MKRTKKNNKGFSLVELIVVVLIMAIIAVALAPQIMKWVDKSRNSSDAAVYDNVVSACQSVLTDEEIWAGFQNHDVTITLAKTGTTVTYNGVDNDVQTLFNTDIMEVLGVDNLNKVKMKATYSGDDVPTITITNGIVERSTEPAAKVTGKKSS